MTARHLLIIAAMTAAAAATAAVPVDSTAAVPPIVAELASGTVEVSLPAGFISRLAARPAAEAAPDAEDTAPASATRAKSRTGYRVQIFDDNNARTAKHEAQARRARVGSRFPEYKTYISFNSPYWRVKVGDFRTRSEAEAAMGAIRAAFPAYGSQLRVVRDRINH